MILSPDAFLSDIPQPGPTIAASTLLEIKQLGKLTLLIIKIIMH